ncbi:putative phage head-tail adaptor, partial [Escherichia coli PA31]
MIETLLDFSGL